MPSMPQSVSDDQNNNNAAEEIVLGWILTRIYTWQR